MRRRYILAAGVVALLAVPVGLGAIFLFPGGTAERVAEWIREDAGSCADVRDERLSVSERRDLYKGGPRPESMRRISCEVLGPSTVVYAFESARLLEQAASRSRRLRASRLCVVDNEAFDGRFLEGRLVTYCRRLGGDVRERRR